MQEGPETSQASGIRDSMHGAQDAWEPRSHLILLDHSSPCQALCICLGLAAPHGSLLCKARETEAEGWKMPAGRVPQRSAVPGNSRKLQG